MNDAHLRKIFHNPLNPGGYSGVDSVYRAARKDNLNITRQEIATWLSSQPAYTLHKPLRKRFGRNPVLVDGIDDQWQADLIDMTSLSEFNQGYRFILACIDVLSKYAWVVPLKNKTGHALVEAFKIILKGGRKPRFIQTDKGTEFKNKKVQDLFKKHHIRFFTTQNETKASIVERFIRTFKSRLWRFFTANNTHVYLKTIPKLISAYNQSYHRSIKMAPASVTIHNDQEVWRTLYKDIRAGQKDFKFQIGDSVLISKTTQPFRKGYLPNWTKEIFTIGARIPRSPPVYKLLDYDKETIEGAFYEEELQKVIKTDDMYEIEKVLMTRKRSGKTEHFVKWLGYPDKFNSWVTALRTL